MTQTKAFICKRIEDFFGIDEKERQACLNLAEFIFTSPNALKRMSMMDVAEVMDSEDPKTVLDSIDFCTGSLGLINTYAEVSLGGDRFEISAEELNEAVRTGRLNNPKTGVLVMYSSLTHPLYKTGSAFVAA